MFEEVRLEGNRTWYFTRSMLRAYLARFSLSWQAIEATLDDFVYNGVIDVGGQRIVHHDDPCRYCGGTGKVLVAKFSDYARRDCDRCNGKGYNHISPDDTVLK